MKGRNMTFHGHTLTPHQCPTCGQDTFPMAEWDLLEEAFAMHFKKKWSHTEAYTWLGITENQYFWYRKRGYIHEEVLEWAVVNC